MKNWYIFPLTAILITILSCSSTQKSNIESTSPSTGLNATWHLLEMAGDSLKEQPQNPYLQINWNEMHVSGTDGCNSLNGAITKITRNQLVFGQMASTKKMCPDMITPNQFNQMLSKVARYKLQANKLYLLDAQNQALASFMKNTPINTNINDIWAATHINGKTLKTNNQLPQLEINLRQMHYYGNDSCNGFNGTIESISGLNIQFGNAISTQKMCSHMETANAFNKALSLVRQYTIENLQLHLQDDTGQTLLSFKKVD